MDSDGVTAYLQRLYCDLMEAQPEVLAHLRVWARLLGVTEG